MTNVLNTSRTFFVFIYRELYLVLSPMMLTIVTQSPICRRRNASTAYVLLALMMPMESPIPDATKDIRLDARSDLASWYKSNSRTRWQRLACNIRVEFLSRIHPNCQEGRISFGVELITQEDRPQ